jgi:serine/threonine protein kinase/Flp pilus assembly protein TadD
MGQLDKLQAAFADRYAIEEPLGRGGSAVVYLAKDLKHQRRVAIKILRPEIAEAVGSARFLREIKIAAQLRHPHIVPLHDSGEACGFIYFVMPLIEGESLRDRIRSEKQLVVEDAVRITCEVADALDYAHRHDVVHRDVKPENILLEDGHAVVVDFGIARAISAAGREQVTEQGLAVGTASYMSPEQASGEEQIDCRSDLYSLGCVLYEMLAGQPPFVGVDARAVIARHLNDPVPPLTTVRPNVPRVVAHAVTKALAKAPADRYASLCELAEALVADEAEEEGPAQQSIAVLPFANMSGSDDSGYLSDGITEEIINVLAKLEGLQVASRTSSFAFKEKTLDVRAIAEQLNVHTVLEGSVRRAGKRLRVTAQLINASDGYHLWSERYDRDMEDVFAIQDEIAQNIARALQVFLSDGAEHAMVQAPTAEVKAYEYYLKGRQFFHQARKRSLQFAREMFMRAIEVDPNYALAYAGVADTSSLLNMYYPSSGANLEQGDAASRRALELAPELAEAHAARGFSLLSQKRNDEAEGEFQEAIRLDPKLFEARYFYARACFQQGKLAQAAALFEEAAAVRDDYQARFFAAQSYAGLDRKKDAEAAYWRALQTAQRHLEFNPDDPRAATMCAVSLCRLGEPVQGLEWAERALAIDPEDAGIRYNVACLYALEGETELALDCLEDAFRHGFGNREWIERDPDLHSRRDDPRFQKLMWAD